MAKYNVLMSCGHEDTVVLFGKGSERERKIKYFESHGLCKKCYKKKMIEEKKKMIEERKAMGLVFDVFILPYLKYGTGEILASVYFSGDTMGHKEEIKSLGGYKWGEAQLIDACGGDLSLPFRWNKIIPLKELEKEMEKAKSINAKISTSYESFSQMINYQVALKWQKEWDMVEKPEMPDILKDHRWNYKVYGRSGNHIIYLDGKEFSITDEQAKELEAYRLAIEEISMSLQLPFIK